MGTSASPPPSQDANDKPQYEPAKVQLGNHEFAGFITEPEWKLTVGAWGEGGSLVPA